MGGNGKLKPLIFGTIDDSATGFKWTQEMKLAFPNSHLMTFQGYFHGFPSPFIARERKLKGLYDCFLAMQEYLRSDVLPRNGRSCTVNRYGVDSPHVPDALDLLDLGAHAWH